MAKKEDLFRECEECGEPIDTKNPKVRLCKRCAGMLQVSRRRGTSRDNPKDGKKKKRKEDLYLDDFDDFEFDDRRKKKKKRRNDSAYDDYRPGYGGGERNGRKGGGVWDDY